MNISTWPGLRTALSPYHMPSGGAVLQENVMSLVPGQLQVRGGMKKLADTPNRILEAWCLSTSPSKEDIILAYAQDGLIHEISGIGGTVSSKTIGSQMLPLTPVSFSQGRRGEVYVFQGHGQRGIVRYNDGYVRNVGLESPTDKPEITADQTRSYYVARIDIVDTGNGYTKPPEVTIGEPQDKVNGRQATAIARIASGKLSEIEVTDGGKGYTRAPYVTISSPVADPSTGTGVAAVLELEEPHPTGDHKSGVVFWEMYLPGGPWICRSYPPRYAPDGTMTKPGGEWERWRDGWVLDTCTTGSGTGAQMWLPLTDAGKRYFSTIFENYFDPNNPANYPPKYPNPCGETFPKGCYMEKDEADDFIRSYGTGLSELFGQPQVYNFGTGYKPGDEVWAYLHTARKPVETVASNGGWSAYIFISYCGTGSAECPWVFKGHIWGAKETPDRYSIKYYSPARQNILKTTIANPGSGYLIPPVFETDDRKLIHTDINPVTGSVTTIYPDEPDAKYLWAPEVIDPNGDAGGAKGVAVVRPNLRGLYQCYYRYVDERVPKANGGPLFSSLSPVTEVDCGDGSQGLTWKVPPIPSWATAIELFRTTSGQATTLFRVARLGGTDPMSKPWAATYYDSTTEWDLVDADRKDFLALPIVLSNGALNANRYGIPAKDFAVGAVFQDRLFLGVDTTGNRPNTIMFSEADEPESMPDINELILQGNLRDTDYITAMVPYAGALIVYQSRHCHRLTYVEDPQTDASVVLLAYRGCLNQRCWDLYEGVLYALDDIGIYSMDPQGQVKNISAQINDLFRESTDGKHPRVDFKDRKLFFVRADRSQKVIRVNVSFVGDPSGMPTRQLVYSVESGTWWVETYPELWTAGTEVRSESGQIVPIVAGLEGFYQLATGLTDEGDKPIAYKWRSGHSKFIDDNTKGGDSANPRSITVTYQPTKADCDLNLSLYYNGSDTPRGNVAPRDRGVGFVHSDTIPAAVLNMKLSDLRGGAPSIASALFQGRTLRDIYGNDRYLATELWGEQTSAGPVVIHTMEVEGVEEMESAS